MFNINAFSASVLVLAICSGNLSAEDVESNSIDSPPSVFIDFYQKYITDLRYGNCRFEPSCSHYAQDAIGEFGIARGSVLAADRLVRCHSDAGVYYTRDETGHWVDPVDGPHGAIRPPIVPSWLLPERASLNKLTEGICSNRQTEYAAFADELAEEGDCWRAETEYKRVAFLSNSHELKLWSHMMTGNCHFRWNDWNDARLEYLDAAEISRNVSWRNAANFMAAASDFNIGQYGRCKDLLSLCDFQGLGDTEIIVDIEQAQFLRGLCSLSLGHWEDGVDRFGAIARVYPDSPYRDKALYLSQKAEQGVDLPSKNATMAAVFSALLPGSGQVYAGRARDGLRHFIFNGLLIYSVYSLIKEDYYAAGFLLGGFTLPFYIGNIVGAKNSAEHYTVARRYEFVSTSIKEAGAK
jgi:putative component of membrane protein insertase Oxa1/YidC/SpoIIIJ protein YidD/TM2 domain-containing membrane protein YozV